MKHLLQFSILMLLIGVISPVNTTNGVVKTSVEVAVQAGVPAYVAELAYDSSTNHGYSYGALLAQMYYESSFRTNVTSVANAYGLMQIRGIAEIDVNRRFNQNLNRFDVVDNISLGILFMQYLYNRYGNIEDALRYYNGGGRFRNNPETLTYANNIMRLSTKYIRLLHDNEMYNLMHQNRVETYNNINTHNRLISLILLYIILLVVYVPVLFRTIQIGLSYLWYIISSNVHVDNVITWYHVSPKVCIYMFKHNFRVLWLMFKYVLTQKVRTLIRRVIDS